LQNQSYIKEEYSVESSKIYGGEVIVWINLVERQWKSDGEGGLVTAQ
jgi:hypothetical protein